MKFETYVVIKRNWMNVCCIGEEYEKGLNVLQFACQNENLSMGNIFFPLHSLSKSYTSRFEESTWSSILLQYSEKLYSIEKY